MFIIPLSHEQRVARRWPWITTVIIILNLAVFAGSWSSDRRASAEVVNRITRALEYFVEHPYLELEARMPELEGALTQLGAAEEQDESALPNAVERELEQAEFDALVRDIELGRQQISAFRFGYRPGASGLSGLLTHQFLHAGLLHLLFNLWFLWLVGCNVEDAWGRLLYPAFYLSAGAVAALCHAAWGGDDARVLVGASGSVAAAMGAFLVNYGKTKIRFFALLLIRPFTFAAPAFLMLPLWAGIELFWGLLSLDSGVAHWAHVGGFGFGLGAALLVRYSGLGQRIEQSIEPVAEDLPEDPEIVRAREALEKGDAATAIARLEALSQQRSATADVFLELARFKHTAGDDAGARAVQLRLLEWYLQRQLPDEALRMFEELEAAGAPVEFVPPHLRLRLARQYRRRGQLERAASEFAQIHAAPQVSELCLPALLGHAELSLELGRPDQARQLYEQAQFYSSNDAQVQAAIRQGLARVGQRPASASSPPPA